DEGGGPDRSLSSTRGITGLRINDLDVRQLPRRVAVDAGPGANPHRPDVVVHHHVAANLSTDQDVGGLDLIYAGKVAEARVVSSAEPVEMVVECEDANARQQRMHERRRGNLHPRTIRELRDAVRAGEL